MIWAILIFLGIPLWFSIGVLLLIRNNASLRERPGNVPVRVKPPGKNRWIPGHAVWIHDVFAFRASPAAWKELLVWVTGADAREPTAKEAKLHRLGCYKISDLYAYDRQQMRQMFGKHGEALYGYARGEDDRPIETKREAKSVSRETTLAYDTADFKELEAHLHEFAAEIEPPLVSELLPGQVACAHRNFHRIDTEQAHATQNKRKNINIEIDGHRIAACSHQPAVFGRFERRSKNIAAHRIDHASPTPLL